MNVFLIGQGALLSRAVKTLESQSVSILGVCPTSATDIPKHVNRYVKEEYFGNPGYWAAVPDFFDDWEVVVLSLNNPFIIPDKILNKKAYFYNIHNGDTDRYRGLAELCILSALINKESEYGVTLQRILPNRPVDGGDTIAKMNFDIYQGDDFETLMVRSLVYCEKLFNRTIEQILNGDTKPIKNRNEITPMTLTYRDLPSLKLRAIGLGTLNVFKLGKFERNFPGLT